MRDIRFKAEHRGWPLNKENHKKLILWACSCVEHVLVLLDWEIDTRIENALSVAKKWGKWKASVGDARNAAFKVLELARESSNPLEITIARATGHAVATAHMADHAVLSALCCLKAVKLVEKSVADEQKWQNETMPKEVKELILDNLVLKNKKKL